MSWKLYNGLIMGDVIRKEEQIPIWDFRINMDLGIDKKQKFITAWSVDKKGDKPRFLTAYRNGK